MEPMIREDMFFKHFMSEDYNYIFNKKTGLFFRWGKTKEDDPQFSPFGPEIADIEIAVGCSKGCKFCYKDNAHRQRKHMSLATFKKLFYKLPRTVCQIAFGITDIDANPDFTNIMLFCRRHGVIPNYTTNGFNVTKEVAEMTAAICGAVAVSVYDKDEAYNAIKLFIDAGMKQTNIHFMLSKETYQNAFDIVNDIKSDARLEKLNAIVFLAYKPKGKNIENYTSVSVDDYKALISHCRQKDVKFGFDSCSAPHFFKSIEGEENEGGFVQMGEPCESTLFSTYINIEGRFYPCSFSEDTTGWRKGLNVLECEDFIKDIWNHPRTQKFRQKLLMSSVGCDCKFAPACRSCPVYNITGCKESENE